MVGKILDGLVLILYPVIVFVGLTFVGVRWTALILLLLVGRRVIGLMVANRARSRIFLYQAVIMAGIIAIAAVSKSPMALRITPFAISVSIIVLFWTSLKTTPVIERFARLTAPDLSEVEVAYCRKLTKVWIGVLAANSTLVLAAAFVENEAVWTILVGPVSYSILGMVFVVEYPYRKWRFRDFDDKSTVDKILKRLIVGRSA